jgi:glucose-6-phosphate isomerase
MKLEYFNCPKPEALDANVLPEAEFLTYLPDFASMQALATKYHTLRNILVIGHGGSITSLIAFTEALKEKLTKKVYILNTVDPDYIYELKQKLNPNDTLVIAISKSGETTTQMEALMQFTGYPLLFVTSRTGPLAAIAQKFQATVVEHPAIGGRYTAFTEVALLPAVIAGMNAELLFKGGREMHDQYKVDNQAWQAASILWQLEQQMYVDVFVPIYSHNLFPASNLIVQLCQESFGKNGKGQTYFAHEAPESQHHTNQRFFGGRKNIAGFTIGVDKFLHPTATRIPQEIASATFKNNEIAALDSIPLEQSMTFERQGVVEDARLKYIPLLELILDNFSEQELGRFIAFWQLFAVYSSILRNVDPFDQPQVEASKKISFDKRLQFKGLL